MARGYISITYPFRATRKTRFMRSTTDKENKIPPLFLVNIFPGEITLVKRRCTDRIYSSSADTQALDSMDFVTIGDYTSMFSTCQKWLSDRKVGLSTVAVSYVSSEETWKLGRFFFFFEREIEIDRVVQFHSIIPTRSLYAITIFRKI